MEDTILGATIRCAYAGCTETFAPRGRKRFCSDACRKRADKESEAFKLRQYTRAVQQHERRILHQRRRRTFTAAVSARIDSNDWRGIQGGVPQAAPRQFPEVSPEAIQRFENAKRLKEKQ